MKFSTLERLFLGAHPDGAIAPDRKPGRINVWYQSGGRCYTYRSGVRDLAARLGLIPEINVEREAEEIVASLLSGDDTVTGHPRCYDTVRYLLYQQGHDYSVRLGNRRTDQYDYPIVDYTIHKEKIA